MTQTQIVLLACIMVYFLFLIWVGYNQSKKQDHKGFVIGGRDVGYLPTIGSLAAGLRDGGGLVFWIGSAYTIGYGGMWLFVGVCFSYIVFAIVGPRVRRVSLENKYITIGQMLRKNIGKSTDKVAAIVILVYSLLAMAIQLYVSGNLFATILGQSQVVGLVAVGVIVAFYLFEGGYGSVIKTDVIQFVIILTLIAVPWFLDIHKEDVLNFSTIDSMGLRDSIAMFLIGFFVPLATADNWQRIFSARDDNVVRYGFPAAGPILILMTLSLIFIGFGLKSTISADEIHNVMFIMFQQGALPLPLLAIMAVAFMAITMSTLDTQTYLFASTVLKDFVPKEYTQDRDNYIKYSKIIIILAMIIMGFIAASISNVVQFLWDAASLIFILAPIFVFTGFDWIKSSRGTDLYLTAVIIVSLVIYVNMFSSGIFADDMIMTSVPVGISLLGSAIGIFLSNKVFDSKEEAVH